MNLFLFFLTHWLRLRPPLRTSLAGVESLVLYLPYPDGDGEDPEGPGAEDQRLSVSASG